MSDELEKPPAASVLDALLPPEMARKAEDIGVRKATGNPVNIFVLAVLAGAFIGLAAMFSTVVTTGAAAHVGFGVTRLLGGVVFSLGLILVVVGGAELFTGNNLIVMAWASRRVRSSQLLKNWALVYAGNFIGAAGTALLVYLTRQYAQASGEVAKTALTIAHTKTQLGFFEAIVLGTLCNALVCLAIWLTLSARSTTDKVLLLVPPIAAFVAAGFEHSVANMYFIPLAMLIQGNANPEFLASLKLPEHLQTTPTWHDFLLGNLLPVTIGNIIGGCILVGMVYWFLYLRGNRTQQN